MVHIFDSGRLWDTQSAFLRMEEMGLASTKRTAERNLHKFGLLPGELKAENIRDGNGIAPNRLVIEWEISEARRRRSTVLFAQIHRDHHLNKSLHLNDARGARYWIVFDSKKNLMSEIASAFEILRQAFSNQLLILPSGDLVTHCQDSNLKNEKNLSILSYGERMGQYSYKNSLSALRKLSPHLLRLEAESIHIFREAIAGGANPVMLHSLGKDSTVMLHLAKKAFYPAKPPFPLLHVDTRWKFQEMYRFRDWVMQESGMNFLIHTNPEAIAKNINPFDHGSAVHTDITKTDGLKQALDHYHFDVIFGGARRDEEKSRAKERIFSFRTSTHRWDPKNQRPELWNLYNTRKKTDESIRVFPLSNWTELDVWHYILMENIPVVSLYFAKERPVVIKNGVITLVDDERIRLAPDDKILRRKVRFRTLGCYPLTGGVESDADDVRSIQLELINSKQSERQGRAIDKDSSGSMEKKKLEGYF